MRIKKKSVYIAYFVLFMLISMNFFEARMLPETLVTYLRAGFLGLTVMISAHWLYQPSRDYDLPVKLYFCAVLFSIFTAYYSWDQPLDVSLKAIVPHLIIFGYFTLKTYRLNTETVEFVVLSLGLIFIALFAFQYINKEVVLFGFRDEFREERGVTRIVFPGGGVLLFTAFQALVGATNEKKRFALPLYILCSAAIIMQVTRQMIAVHCFFSCYHLLRHKRLKYKTTALIAIGICCVFFGMSSHPIAKGLRDTTKEHVTEGEKYIRVQAAEYFLLQMAPDTLTQLLGNGVPNNDRNNRSPYGAFYQQLVAKDKFYLADVGIIGVYSMFGVLAVLAWIMIWTITVFIKLPYDKIYIKYYLLTLLITSFTSSHTFDHFYMPATVAALYIAHKSRLDSKQINPINHKLRTVV